MTPAVFLVFLARHGQDGRYFHVCKSEGSLLVPAGVKDAQPALANQLQLGHVQANTFQRILKYIF